MPSMPVCIGGFGELGEPYFSGDNLTNNLKSNLYYFLFQVSFVILILLFIIIVI